MILQPPQKKKKKKYLKELDPIHHHDLGLGIALGVIKNLSNLKTLCRGGGVTTSSLTLEIVHELFSQGKISYTSTYS